MAASMYVANQYKTGSDSTVTKTDSNLKLHPFIHVHSNIELMAGIEWNILLSFYPEEINIHNFPLYTFGLLYFVYFSLVLFL